MPIFSKVLTLTLLITVSSKNVFAQDYIESVYTLVPSVSTITMPVSSKDTGYDGLNLTVFKNGVAIYDQANVKFDWSISDPSVLAINTWTSEALCQSESCTTHSVKLRGLKSGKTGIYVVAYIDGIKSAATTIQVDVQDTWSITLLKAINTLQVGEIADFQVVLNKNDDPKYKPSKDISYIWQIVSSSAQEASISLNPLPCDSSCTYPTYQIMGLHPGKSTIEIVAMSAGDKLATLKYDVSVKGTDVWYENDSFDEILPVDILPVDVEYKIKNEKWEDIPDEVKAEYPYLQAQLEEHNKLLEEQQRLLREQEVRLKSTESLLQKILTMLRGFFN